MQYVHKKSGRIYTVLNMGVINATNENDGDVMVLYEGRNKDGDGVATFVREKTEFLLKFESHETVYKNTELKCNYEAHCDNAGKHAICELCSRVISADAHLRKPDSISDNFSNPEPHDNIEMKTLKDHPQYDILKRLYPLAVERGFVGEWEEIEDCELFGYKPTDYIEDICMFVDSGIAGRYVWFLYEEMNIKDLSNIPDEFKSLHDHVCVNGEEYYHGEEYWFSNDGKNWKKEELQGYISGLSCFWRSVKDNYQIISKTSPTPHKFSSPTPEQIGHIKGLFKGADKLVRNGDTWIVLSKNSHHITEMYIPDSKSWYDVIVFGGAE